MSFDINFKPQKPFDNFKWQWATVQCTESINTPIVLLGVLSKMRKLEGQYKYSSTEFADELRDLENDIKDSITVNLSQRTGERNLIRNSGQYWKALGLIDDETKGLIKLTDLGHKVADREISQAEFGIISINSLTLPNVHVMKLAVCNEWFSHNLTFKPLKLILNILVELNKTNNKNAYLTANELIKIIIPLSGVRAEISDYVNFVMWYRSGAIDLDGWSDCCTRANDKRMAREFLLFLFNYGYLNIHEEDGNYNTKYYLNTVLLEEVIAFSDLPDEATIGEMAEDIRNNDIASDVERKRIVTFRTERPNQSKFRKSILESFNSRCILTGVSMSEVLEAAHIKPVQFKGNDSIGNGLCMRIDIHQLFDTGHLRISTDGIIFLSPKAKAEYNNTIPTKIDLPNFVNKDYIKWRWDNYNGI